MGFNALDIATHAAAISAGGIALALVSPNEADHATWKKFDNNPNMQLVYNRPPTVPGALKLSTCFAACTSPATTRDTTPQFSARSTDGDGDVLHYQYDVWGGWAASPTAHLDTTGALPAIAQGTTSFWTGAYVYANGGQYEYKVRVSDGVDWSGWSAWMHFTVDTSQPAPPKPTITGATTDPNVNMADYVGTVGKPMITMTFDQPEDASMSEIVYSLFSDVPVYASPPACNTHVNGIVSVCRVGGTFPTQTIAAATTSSTLKMRGFDSAGNVSQYQGSTPIWVNPDITGVKAGHSWHAMNDGSTPAGAIPDTATTGNNPQTLAGSTVTAPNPPTSTDAPNPLVTNGYDDQLQPIPEPEYVSNFSGAGALKSAAGSAAVLNMASSFTVAAWVKPTNNLVLSSGAYAIMAQEGTAVSGFFLDAYAGNWRFCMPTTQNVTFNGNCASTPIASSAVGTWTYIVAQWDVTNQVLRLSAGTPGGNWASIVTHTPPTAAASGVFDVGVRNQPGQLFPFQGSIFDPVAIQAIADTTALTALSQYFDPKDLPLTA